MPRVAVIEIGSRAVRLLVADASPSGLAVVANAVELHLLSAIGGRGELPYETAIKKIGSAVMDFKSRAERSGADTTLVFGTEIVRTMSVEQRSRLELLAGTPITVLEGEDEGRASFMAGIVGLESEVNSKDGQFTVIDQGGGSMEIAWGLRLDAGITLQGYEGFRLGANELRKMVSSRGTVATLREVRGLIESREVPSRPGVETIVLGSAITTVAWADIRPNASARYHPNEVHGLRVPLSRLAELVKWAAADRTAYRLHIDPRNPDGGEPEVVEAGILGLAPMIRHLGVRSVTVSGWGTRYGVAWMLGNGGVKSA